jgi:glutathione S-transferase
MTEYLLRVCLQVWGRRSSFNVQKVMWLIGELGIVHQHTPGGGQYGGNDAPEFLSMDGLVSSKPASEFLTGVFWGVYRTPEAQRDLPAIAGSVALCANFFECLDQLLSQQPVAVAC